MDAATSLYLAHPLGDALSQASNAGTYMSILPEHAAARSVRFSALASAAAETKLLLPSLLASMPIGKPYGILYSPDQSNFDGLCQSRCPKLEPSPVRVLNADTLDTALTLSPNTTDRNPVLILNMANALHGGRG